MFSSRETKKYLGLPGIEEHVSFSHNAVLEPTSQPPGPTNVRRSLRHQPCVNSKSTHHGVFTGLEQGKNKVEGDYMEGVNKEVWGER